MTTPSAEPSTSLQAIIEVDSGMPIKMGVLRATVRDLPLRSSQSRVSPHSTPPANQHASGRAATKLAFRMDVPRSFTKRTGNQVRSGKSRSAS